MHKRMCVRHMMMRQQTRLPCPQELVEGPWRQNNLDANAAMVIPVPLPLGGVVVVGEAVIAYIDGAQQAKTVPLKSTIVRVRPGRTGSGPHFLPERGPPDSWFVLAPVHTYLSGCARHWCRGDFIESSR